MLWGLQPIEQQAAYGLAVENLRRLIHLGLLLPGERMPAERKLAEEINVSRVTLREALRVLETEGYLAVKRGARGGAFVADEARLDDLARHRIARDPGYMMRVLEFRELNEKFAARCASMRRTPADIKHLRGALGTIEAAESPAALRRAESVFHMLLAQASHNSLLARAVEEALIACFMPLPVLPFEESRTQSWTTHRAVVDAIEAKHEADAEKAAAETLALGVLATQNLLRVA